MAVLVATLVFTALVPRRRVGAERAVLILAAMVVVALWTSGVARLRSYPIVILLSVATMAALSPLLTGGKTLAGALSLIDAALVATTLAAIGLGAIDQGEVNRQSLRAAICVYLLVGLVFVFVYGAARRARLRPVLRPGNGRHAPLASTSATSRWRRSATATTRRPATSGILLAVFEALIGQLYLVTVLALLVSNLGRKRSEARGE